MYLEPGQQKLTTRLCAGLAATLFLGAGYLAIANPQRVTQADIELAHKSGQEGVAFEGIKPQNQTVAAALILVAMASALGVVAYQLADGTPKTLAPSVVVEAARPTAPNLTDIEDEKAWAELRDNVTQLCQQVPWLQQLMRAESIVLIGDSGSGKSSVAQAIAILRSILFGWSCDIYDPDADNNLARNTWIHGDVVGVRKRAETLLSQKDFAGQLAAALPESMAARADGEGHTIIFDEISGWDDYGVPVSELNGIYSAAVREIRRKNIHPMFILHGSEKGMAGGDDIKSGLVAKVLQKSFVITLQPEADKWGQTVFKGKASLKPKGDTYTVNGKYKNISIPPQLAPLRLVAELLGEAFDEFGFGVRGFEADGDRKEAEAFQRELAEMWMDKDKAIARLRKSFDTPMMRSAMARYNGEQVEPVAPGFDVDSHPEGDFIKELAAYLQNPATSTKADEQGYYSVRDIWRNKVKDSNRFQSVDEFKEFLRAIDSEGAGKYRTERPEGWRPI